MENRADGDSGAASASGAGGSGSSAAKATFEVKKWNAVAFWSWEIELDVCAICRNSLYEPSIEHQAAGLDDVSIAWGVCNHCFHLECIQRWLRQRNVCPMCGTEWEYQKVRARAASAAHPDAAARAVGARAPDAPRSPPLLTRLGGPRAPRPPSPARPQVERVSGGNASGTA